MSIRPCSNFLFFLLIYVLIGIVLNFASVIAQESKTITTPELTKRSQKIVIGQVIDQYSAWDDLGREIYTYTKLGLDRVIKSNQPDSILVLRHLGGKVGNIESHVAGLPRFRKGERVLVFLGPYSGTSYYGLIDWNQGKYVIKQNKLSKEVLQGAGPAHGQSVDKFVAELKRYL